MSEKNGAYGVFLAGGHEPGFVERMRIRFRSGDETRAHYDTIGTQAKCGRETSCVGDAAGGQDQRGCDGIHDARQKNHRGDLTGHVSARLYSLRNDHVHPCLLSVNRRIYRANLMQHSDTRGVGGGYEFRRISPEERQGGNSLLNAHLNARMMREVEDEVHPKGPGRQRAEKAEVLLQQGRRAKLRLENAEPAGVAYGGNELRSRQIGPHRRNHDWSVDPKPLAKACF